MIITVGLTPHRLEFLPATLALMAEHRSILLEEPPHPDFAALMQGKISIEQFVEESEAGFPEYSKASYQALQRLYAEGRCVCQVGPYLERQIQIQILLEEGLRPEEIAALPELSEVYQREHEATGALLDFYTTMGASFDTLVEKLKAFAQADARRLDLRDRLRAQAILWLARKLPGPLFVEAGYIHLRLIFYLARGKGAFRLRVKNLLLEATQARGLGAFWPSPGDGLTAFYLLGSKHRHVSADLLAARSLVYIKLIEKNELAPTPEEPFPHLREELVWRIFVSSLCYEECKALDKLIRLLPTSQAQKVVRDVWKERLRQAEKIVTKAFRQTKSFAAK